ESFRAPLNIGGNDVIITFSIGVAVDTAGDATPRELLLNASLAMERAKKKGKGRFEIFDRELGKQAIHRLNLETRLRQAPFAGEMRVHYQPEVLLESGRIAGMEALVRWQHPVHGLLGPDKFIPMAEETGLIVRVGRWILGEALATLGAIRRLTPLEDAFHLSVNVSVAQLEHDPDFLDHLGEVLAAEGILPGHLVIEITETAQEMEPLVEVLEQIRMMGVGVAIDDFGTGYSSLSRLKSLPASVVKVDQRFVRGIQDPANLAIVRSVVDLASVLNLEVTAEGIETPRQLELVRSAGCNRGCGYYFSKPVPREQLMELLVHGVLPAARFTTAATLPALPALPAAPPAPHQPSPLSGT
ncbi:MAG TPA: GGDEF domain-containing phosphodiesterase, partial [Acidimicrobiales bacterium]|nr:GGDEF domain-containing phosphodiesterase [Acidimicrobiales bacterium]